MSKRNFILLIIILALVISGLFTYLYFRANSSGAGDASTGTNFLSQFNPFKSNTPPPATNTDSGTPVDLNGDGVISTDEVAAVSKLKKVSTMPIAGFTVFSKERLKDVPIPPPVQTQGDVVKPKTNKNPVKPPTEFAPALRYIERSTGNVYQTFVDKIEERRFTGTVIPKIYDAYWGVGATSVVMRHLKSDEVTIETFLGTLPKEILGQDSVASNELKGYFLPDNIKDISMSPDGTKIFYLTNTGGSAVGIVQNLSDGKKTQVFNSAFTEWNSFWGSNNVITLTTKPSSTVAGYMYAIDVAKKSFTEALGNINGLTTMMSPNGKLVLVSNSDLSLYVYHIDTKAYDTLGVKTLAEKCVWGKAGDTVYCAVPVSVDTGTYPDDWYRGEVSFSDQIWKINLKDGSTSMIADPFSTPNGEDLDGTKLALDSDENYLFFVNKKDSYLWELSLK